MMSQPRQFHMVGGNYNYNYNYNGGYMSDTTYTKLFVGGLAWETQRDTMKKYFEQFGEILEAVVITDKTTGRSKGYGFVTFKEPEAAFRACQNPSPVIDGRRANCNLASFGVQKNHPPTPQHVGIGGRFRPSPGLMTAPTYPGSSSYFQQPANQPPFPYSAYGYTGYPSHDTMYQMNYYGAYGQQMSPYYQQTSGVGVGVGVGVVGGGTGGGGGASGATGYFHNYYPYYGPYAQSSQGHGFGFQYPQMVQQYPFLPQQHLTSTGILSLPTSTMSMPTGVTATVGVMAGTLSGPSQVSTGVTSEENSTT